MHLVLKLIHVVAVIVFIGNISLGIFWKEVADRSREPRIMAHTMRSIILADRLFTIPAIVLIIAAGVATAMAEHLPILATGWILWSIILFVISGLAFMPVTRLQREMAAVADEGVKTGTVDAVRYHSLSVGWNFWGFIALVAPLGAVALMVLKPLLPAFP
jgi:uncharacterized membrane protein